MSIIKKAKYKEFLVKWLKEKECYVKESTYATYSNIIHTYLLPNLGDINISKINYDLIQTFILKLYNHGNGLSIKTIKDIIVIVKGSLRMCFNTSKLNSFDLLFKYPTDNKDKKMYVLTKKEQNILMKYVLDNINNKNIGILLSLFYGVRIGEICALKWKDFNFKTNIMHINKTIQRIYMKDKNITKVIITTPKSKSANRDIPINGEVICILKKLKTTDEDFILTGNSKYIEPRLYRYYFANILKKLKINKFKFHSLRHTFATNCISLGIDYKTISELLGHSSINITLNLYVHPSLLHKQKCIELLHKKLYK